MSDDAALDEAIQLATERTREAQEIVEQVIDQDGIPPEPLVEVVVERADDLSTLTHEAAEES
jgi:hypothetical protein